jgi:hypothetical protein
MPGSELIAWEAYYSIYPFRFDRDDVHHAQLLATILNEGRATRAQAAGKRSFESVKVSELIPEYITPEVTVHDPKQRKQYQAWKANMADINARRNNGS